MLIYIITNKINGKKYIGQTTQTLKDRWRDHCLVTKSKQRSAIRSAIAKYGKDNFKIEVIYRSSSVDDLNNKEEMLIKHIDTLSPNGYNLVSGGKNFKHHQTTKDKISNYQRRRMKKVLCVETGDIYESVTLTAFAANADKGNIIKHMKSVSNYTNIKGYTFKYTENTSNKNRENTIFGELKQINKLNYYICSLDGKAIEEFTDKASCARKYNLRNGNIQMCLVGKRKTHGGYKFIYKKEYQCQN